MDKTKLVKIIAKNYFNITEKTNYWIEKIIQSDLERSKKSFFKTHHIEPREEDIKDLKKEIVMKKGLLMIFILFLLGIVFIR